MHFLGIDWLGVNAENGRKLLLSFAFVIVVLVVGASIRKVAALTLRGHLPDRHAGFWTRQTVSLMTALILTAGLLSIWFNDPTRLATIFGLLSAGLAFALQQVVTAVAGYLVILRGETFTVGDRISMGGVRGDVMRLGFIQTTIMEMGQPAGVTGDTSMWVHSTQFTGRIVTISNAKIFSEPVYNYTRDFPFIWEEMGIPIGFKSDRTIAEHVMLAAAERHAFRSEDMADGAKDALKKRFGVDPGDLAPRVFYRITSEWLELTVRFIVAANKTRVAKDAIARDILRALDEAGIAIAPTRYEIVTVPPLSLQTTDASTQPAPTICG